MAEFEIFKNGRSESRVEWADQEMIIGRDLLSDLYLNDPIVSRQHARIIALNGSLMVEDLKTRNGTFVNGRKEFRRVLKQGDRIEFGAYVILVHLQEGETFADNESVLLQGEELQEMPSEQDMGVGGGFIAGGMAENATCVASPEKLARMRQEAEIRMRPHLVLESGGRTFYFPLKQDATLIGADSCCHVRVQAMKRPRAAVAERLEDGTFQIKKLGLCVDLTVGRKRVRRGPLTEDDAVSIEGVHFWYRSGAKKAAED